MSDWLAKLYSAPSRSTNSVHETQEGRVSQEWGLSWAYCPSQAQKHKRGDLQHEHLCSGMGQKAREMAEPESSQRHATYCQHAQNERIMAQGNLSRQGSGFPADELMSAVRGEHRPTQEMSTIGLFPWQLLLPSVICKLPVQLKAGRVTAQCKKAICPQQGRWWRGEPPPYPPHWCAGAHNSWCWCN